MRAHSLLVKKTRLENRLTPLAFIAQLGEHLFSVLEAVGSNPTRTIAFMHLLPEAKRGRKRREVE